MTEDQDKKPRPLKRREFIVHTSISAVALLMGCGDDDKPTDKPGADLGMDLGADLAPDMAMEQDLGEDQGPDAPVELASPITKPPFVQFMDAGTARLRFESNSMSAHPVTLTRAMTTTVTPTLRTDEVAFSWPSSDSIKRRIQHPDNPGSFTMQDVLITGLTAGEVVRWSVGDGVTMPKMEGSFMAPPAPGTPVRIGWFSDTMMPACEEVCAMFAALKPELVLHGGDIQYMTNPFDTWSGALNTFAPLTQNAAIHFCIGNHEYEEQSEFDAQYVRIFGAHGEADRTMDYHVFNFGSARIFMLNSEIEMADPDSAQNKWLRAHLEALPAGMVPIVAFHRPYFTFSKSRPNFQTRDLLHPVFMQYNVPLVLTGHNHGYERFEVDGIQYIVDAGGGAAIYAVDDGKEAVLAERPGDEFLRKADSATFGAMIIEMDAAGGMKINRYDKDAKIVDSITIAAR
jgi:predicted phosphodiesterase